MTDSPDFQPGQRVHSQTDTRRTGTVKYVGPVNGYNGNWVGVDWDNNDGKHDGQINGVRYFTAKSERSGSFIRPQNLSSGISIVEGLKLRYRGNSTKEEEDEMYVLSAGNRRVSVEFVGEDKVKDKLSRFDELTSVSVSYLGVSCVGSDGELASVVPNLKELDLTGNLFSDWKDVGAICDQLPDLTALNLSYNSLANNISGLQQLTSIHILVLNCTGIQWPQVEKLKEFLPVIEELHLIENQISKIELESSNTVQGFDSLRILNLEDNCIVEWDEILKLSRLKSLEQLYLNKNKLKNIFYPDNDTMGKPFQKLRCLLLGSNNIDDVGSVDSLNSFPELVDIRLSDNPIADPARGGIPRYMLLARLAKVEILNGSEVRPRERKESEIRYVHFVISKSYDNPQEIRQLHPRYYELKKFHGIEHERPSIGAAGPQKMAAGLLSIHLKCVGASIGEKPLLTKKVPASTTVGKLKILCETFFNLRSIKPKLFLQEEGSPFPVFLDDEMASLVDIGIGNGSTILIDEES